MTEPTDLYRLYDSSDTLLYVGISYSAIVRLSQHKSDKTWFDQVARIEIEKLPSRQSALTAELTAIRDENPIYNVTGRIIANKPHKQKHAGPVKRRSSRGKGSVYKDTERGTWVGAAVVNGQRIRVRAKTKLEVRDQLNEIIAKNARPRSNSGVDPAAVARLIAQRLDQGFPARVTDPSVLADIRTIVRRSGGAS